ADGWQPQASLVSDVSGNLYGTALRGGVNSVSGAPGLGLVFKLDTFGNLTVLHTFTGPDGSYPYAGLALDPVGNLYGTTSTGGAANYGVVFKVSPAGSETVLYSFTGKADGGNPYAGVTLDGVGNVYGTATTGGGANFGVVFELDTAGHETALHSF